MTAIAVLNNSTLVSNADVISMCRLVSYQVQYNYAPAWGVAPSKVAFYTSETMVSPNMAKIAIFDDSDTPGAAGWHSANAGQPFGRVFARPAMNAGGDALMRDPTVSSILSHEVLELIGDPSVNFWASDLGIHGGGSRLYALEMCDAVEGDSYTVNLTGSSPLSGRVSNFLKRSWFDPTGAPAPFDYLRRLSAPFTMTAGGYIIYEDETGQQHQVFGEHYPEWRKQTKLTAAARTVRRTLR